MDASNRSHLRPKVTREGYSWDETERDKTHQSDDDCTSTILSRLRRQEIL